MSEWIENLQNDTTESKKVVSAQHKLLLIDDEQKILDALKRLLFEEDYEIETATSGKEALEKMNHHIFSLIISDQQMPEMRGTELLQKAKERYPETFRIMLTGHSDIKDAIAAINKGEVYRYITKPWEDEEIRLIVKEALKHYDLIAENRELHALIKEQNKALKFINTTLEQKVQERSHQIEEKNKELERSFITSIRVFAGLLAQYDDYLGKHSKRVSVFARRLAQSMELSDSQVLDTEIAAILHDIGAISLPKRIFHLDRNALSKTELLLLERHPVVGQESVMAIEKLQKAGTIIRHHHERYDGRGYPDGLQREEIPLEARIIAVADSYDFKSNASSYYQEASPQLAIDYLVKNRGSIFDPEIVNAFSSLLGEVTSAGAKEVTLPFSKLAKGMKLSRGISTKSGTLLIDRDSVIQEKDLERIKEFHKIDPVIDKIYLHRKESE